MNPFAETFNTCRIIYLQGSGKTLAFGIPVVEHLLTSRLSSENEQRKSIRALILAPTRELVMQIKEHIRALLKYTSFKVTITFFVNWSIYSFYKILFKAYHVIKPL